MNLSTLAKINSLNNTVDLGHDDKIGARQAAEGLSVNNLAGLHTLADAARTAGDRKLHGQRRPCIAILPTTGHEVRYTLPDRGGRFVAHGEFELNGVSVGIWHVALLSANRSR